MMRIGVVFNMQDIRALTSASVLEALWETRQKDMIDLITPFIMFSVAKTTSPGQQINVDTVAAFAKVEFGYNEMPSSVVEKVLNRESPSRCKRENKKYYLSASLDNEVELLQQRRDRCQERIDILSDRLSDYLGSHCKKIGKVTNEQAQHHMEAFFGRYGLYLGTSPVTLEALSPNEYEIDYYIAQYIFEQQRSDSKEYSYIMDLVKGFFLSTAIYLQPENGNIVSANYNNTAFYYDTPFLIRLLGYQSKREQDAAKELHTMLKRHGGKFYYFPQTEKEIISILTAYQHSASNGSRSLEGLDVQGYTSTGIDRLKKTFAIKLAMPENDIHLAPLPGYPQNADGTVDNAVLFPELDIQEYVRKQIGHYKQDRLEADIASASAIARLRNGVNAENIENCVAIFVTTNIDFARSVNNYCRDVMAQKSTPLVITDADLSALVWVKCNSFDNRLPQRQLLANAYMAMQPPAELFEKMKQILGQMKEEGTITNEEARAIRTSRYIQKELNRRSMGDPGKITVGTVLEIQKAYEKQLTESLNEQYNTASREKNMKQIYGAIEKAHQQAAEWKFYVEKTLNIICAIVFLAIFFACIGSVVESFENTKDHIAIVPLIVSFVSLLSFYDTVKSRKMIFSKIAKKLSNQFETKIYEWKKEEYLNLIPIAKEELSQISKID